MRAGAVIAGLLFVVGLGAAIFFYNQAEQRSSEAEPQPNLEAVSFKEPEPADREIIGGPTSGRPYSPAVKIGNTVYVSGQIAIDINGNEVRDSVEAETEQVLKNIERWLGEAGFEMSDVVRATVFLTDINDYDAMNSVYVRFFPENPPARACVAVKELVRGFRIEISAIAQK